jgi:hypothetical protein
MIQDLEVHFFRQDCPPIYYIYDEKVRKSDYLSYCKKSNIFHISIIHTYILHSLDPKLVKMTVGCGIYVI